MASRLSSRACPRRPQLNSQAVQGADNAILCRLVANHSYAIIEARQRGLAHELSNEYFRASTPRWRTR